MRNIMIIGAAVAALGLAGAAYAEDGALTGAAGGAVTGAVVGGPVGAAVGGVAGAIVGTAIDPPPQKVVTYVEQQPVTGSIVVEQPVVVGKAISREVVLTPIPDEPRYAYTVVNEQRIIVDPETNTVVRVLN